MNFTVIFLSFAGIFLAYLFFTGVFRIFAESELRKNGCEILGGAVIIFAEAESLEYLLRMASVLPYEEIDVIIDTSRADSEETEYITSVFAQRLRNIEIIYI